jgi:hypothetical protein
MKAMYEARVEDMSAADRLRVECDCSRVALFSITAPVKSVIATPRVAINTGTYNLSAQD